MSIIIKTMQGKEIAEIRNDNNEVVGRFPTSEGARINYWLRDDDWED